MTTRTYLARASFTAAMAIMIAGCTADTTTEPSRLWQPKVRAADLANLTNGSVLFSQTSLSANLAGMTNNYKPTIIADDFVVPSGQVWTVAAVSLTGNLLGSSVTFSIRPDVNGDPGNPLPNALYNVAPTASDPNACACAWFFTGQAVTDYLFPLPTPLSLTEGTYFIAVHNTPTLSTPVAFYWQNHEPYAGYPGLIWGVVPGVWSSSSADHAFALFGPTRPTQTITFPPMAANPPVGSTATLNATASSQLGVNYSSLTTDICTVDATIVSFNKLGVCTIAADQAGDDNFAPATRVTQSVDVGLAQTIVFNSSLSPAYINGSYAPNITGGGSGNPIVLTAGPPTVCTSSNGSVQLIGLGLCTVTANQNGNDKYQPAPSNTQVIKVDYRFDGFRDPVKNEVLNTANAGKSIAFKWRVTDAGGQPVTTLANLRLIVEEQDCDSGELIGRLTSFPIANADLQNLGGGSYQYDWKSLATYARSCRAVMLQLGEGSGPRVARFAFSK